MDIFLRRPIREILNTLYNLMGLVFVLGTIISMGLSLTINQIIGPLRNLRFVIIALLANFVVPPILALVLIQVFSLDESIAVGLLLVSLAAGAPGLPKMAEFAKLDTAIATSLSTSGSSDDHFSANSLAIGADGGLGHILGYRFGAGLPDLDPSGNQSLRVCPLS
jgi:hypothetical protein